MLTKTTNSILVALRGSAYGTPYEFLSSLAMALLDDLRRILNKSLSSQTLMVPEPTSTFSTPC